ncbi:hypothetical protein [Streptomyces sp. NPDC101393]|uniref:hypothetical protein n=1 Tax=Streptomyces sp. NPDC101393 TaxID=3366141 RepID=UPI0037F25B0B
MGDVVTALMEVGRAEGVAARCTGLGDAGAGAWAVVGIGPGIGFGVRFGADAGIA